LNNNLAQNGAIQQSLQQQIIDAAKGQWGGQQGAGTDALSKLIAAMTGGQVGSGSTTTGSQSKTPGIFDFLPILFS